MSVPSLPLQSTAVPSALYQLTSGRSPSASGWPVRNVSRRTVGCSRRKSISDCTKRTQVGVLLDQLPIEPAIVRCPGSRRCCCRAACGGIRRRPRIIGTPWLSSSVASMFLICRSRSASIVVPPRRALRRRSCRCSCCCRRRGCLRRWPRCACRCSYTRSLSVKPSCEVMKLML